jgi:hypothetical protein
MVVVVFVGDFIEGETVLKPDNHPAQTRAISDQIVLFGDQVCDFAAALSVKTNGVGHFNFNVFSDCAHGNSVQRGRMASKIVQQIDQPYRAAG